MVTKIRQKIRALVSDFSLKDAETFTYATSYVFTIAESNITISAVLVDGVALEAADYSYSSTTGKITIDGSGLLSTNSVVEVDYTYTKYSNTELDEYIRAALVWISIFSPSSDDYEIESGDVISPTPDNKMCDLISIIASILINPDYNEYKLPTMTVVYGGRIPKEQKIEKLLCKYNAGLGVADLIEFDIENTY
jgi:hypothetical protein